MTIFLTILHIIVSFILIGVVLLQSGKGAEMGASFGSSGSQSVFGAGGGSTFLGQITRGAAVIFMLTSLSLAYLSGLPSSSSIMSGKIKPVVADKPSENLPAGQPPAAPVTQDKTPANQSVPAQSKK